MLLFGAIFSVIVFLGACSQTPAPLTTYGANAGAGSAGMHTVSRGDTVYSISKRYKVEMPDVILANNLAAPFRLNIGQRLKLPAPKTYEVRSGDSIYTISRLLNVSQSRLVDLNNLSAPYRILPGQILRIPRVPQLEPAITRSTAQPTAKVAAVSRAPLSSSEAQAQKQKTTKSVPAAVSNVPNPTFTKPGQFMSPVNGKVVSSFGPKANGLHNDGVNIEAPRGTIVKAAANGKVVYAGSGLKGYGNLILIKHGGRYLTAYGHLGEIKVKKGAVVKAGDTIGRVGSSGQVKKPQLHFEIRKGTEALNPSKFI